MAILLGDAFVRLSANDDQLDKDLASARGKTESWASGLAGNVAKFAGGAVLAGVGALVTGVAAIGTAAFSASSEFDTATKKIQAQLGLTDEAAARTRDAMENIFANNFGDSIEDVGNAISQVEEQFARIGGTGGADQLQKITEKALSIRDAFDKEVNESTNAAVELMEKFGLTSDQAFDFIAAGFQRGLNSSDDFLESIGEYSTQFANGGATADQFFSVMETGLQGGVLGTDKAADAFKEFTLRIQDGSKLTTDSLKMLGLDAEAVTRGLGDGTLTVADAFEMVLDKLREIEDPTIRMQAAVGVIGTQYEDLGDSAVRALDLNKTSLDDLIGSADKLAKQYDTWGQAIEGFRRRFVVAISPLGDFMLDSLNSVLPQIEAWFTKVEGWITEFITNSNFEWSPEFKQVKLGDLFEWVSAEGLGVSRTKIADWFDLTLGTEGIQQLTLGDFFTFISGEGGGASINLADFVTFIYDNATGNVALTLEDVFTFVSDAEKTVINLGDYVSFTYDKSSGGVALTLSDVFSFVSTEKITTINLGDYVRFIWTSEGVKLKLGDVFTLDTTEGTNINLANYLVVKYDTEGKPVQIRIGELYELTSSDGGKKEEVNIGKFLTVTGTPTSTVTKFELSNFFAFVTPVTWSAILSLGAVPTITKFLFGDFFDFSEKPTVENKFTLSDFIEGLTGDKEEAKFTIGDFFDLTANKPEGFVKMTIGDFVVFNNGEEAKFSWGDIFSLTSGAEGITRLTIGQLIDLESDGGFGGIFADASEKLGKALEEAAANFTIDSPQWVQDMVNWKPSDGAPQWVKNLLSWSWPDAPVSIGEILKWVWPAAPTSIDEILEWIWPDFGSTLAAQAAAIVGFVWPEFGAALASAIRGIINFKWPKLEAPEWLTDLLNFSVPAPGWVQSLIDLWGGSSSSQTSSFGQEGGAADDSTDDNSVDLTPEEEIGRARAFLRRSTRGGATVIIERLIVNNNQDAEEIAYTIAKRLAYT